MKAILMGINDMSRERRGRMAYRGFFGALGLVILLTFGGRLWMDYQANDLFHNAPEQWLAPDGAVYDHTGRGVCAEEERTILSVDEGVGDGVVRALYEDAGATCYSGFRVGAGGRIIYMVVEADRVQVQ